jgi:hypothetical protein
MYAECNNSDTLALVSLVTSKTSGLTKRVGHNMCALFISATFVSNVFRCVSCLASNARHERKKRIILSVKCPLILSGINQIWMYRQRLVQPSVRNFMKVCSASLKFVTCGLIERQTDISADKYCHVLSDYRGGVGFTIGFIGSQCTIYNSLQYTSLLSSLGRVSSRLGPGPPADPTHFSGSSPKTLNSLSSQSQSYITTDDQSVSTLII